MSCESSKTEEGLTSPRKRGLIRFNPKFTRQNSNGSSQDQSEANPTSTFPKPRKYFDSADFFMREEMKNHNSSSEKKEQSGKSEGQSEKPEKPVHHASSLASECETVGSESSSDNVQKNVVPLILLRRSKSSAVINSADGMDEEPESLPTTVEVINGPSSREIPTSSNSSNESSPNLTPVDNIHAESPSPEGGKSTNPRTREEVRSLLIPRLTKVPSRDDCSLAASASSPRNIDSPLKSSDDETAVAPADA